MGNLHWIIVYLFIVKICNNSVKVELFCSYFLETTLKT